MGYSGQRGWTGLGRLCRTQDTVIVRSLAYSHCKVFGFYPEGRQAGRPLRTLGGGWINGVCIFKQLILAAVSDKEN